MTKFQKQMLTIAAAGALTAVTALPAMAFENEFHGIFNFNSVFSNYNNGGGGDINPGTSTWGNNKKMNNYMEQRGRIQYIAKASDDLKMVAHLENNVRWGDSAVGGDLDTDAISTIAVKHWYLDFNIGKGFNTKVGLQAVKDNLKGIFIDADAPLIMTTTKAGAYTLGFGFGRFADDQINYAATDAKFAARAGDADKDLLLIDNTFAFSKDTKLGLSYYLLADYAASNTGYTKPTPSSTLLNGHTRDQAVLLHTLGLFGETKIGSVGLSGFAAMQMGQQQNTQNSATSAGVLTSGINGRSRYFHGWAANIAADAQVGSGKLKTAFLFTSGARDRTGSNYQGWVSTSVDSYNESGMMIIARNTYNSPTSTDQYIRRDVTNIALLSMGYDAKVTEKMNLAFNVGAAWAPSSTDAPVDYKMMGTRNGSDYMGTEINLEAGYQLYKNLKLQAQAGYMFLGGYYNNSTMKSGTALSTSTNAYTASTLNALNAVTPENPYTMRLQARYAF